MSCSCTGGDDFDAKGVLGVGVLGAGEGGIVEGVIADGDGFDAALGEVEEVVDTSLRHETSSAASQTAQVGLSGRYQPR